MATGRPIYYWDACVFIAWIKDEIRAAGQMDGIADQVKLIDKGQAILATSVLSRIEVLESHMSDEDKGKFDAALERRWFQPIACDIRVADKAHEIRDFYQKLGQKLTTPDAIHLASALIYQADVLYTFDGARSKTPEAKRVKLVPLSGRVADKYGLRIEVPYKTPDLLSGVPGVMTGHASTESAQLSARSAGAEKEIAPPTPPLHEAPAAVQRTPLQGSSAAPPAQSKK